MCHKKYRVENGHSVIINYHKGPPMYQKFTSSEFQQKLSFMVIENVLLYLSVDSAINGLVWHLIMMGLTNFKFLTQK